MDNIIAQWEISGSEWEQFKERKCSPNAIKRSSLFLSIFVASVIGLLFGGLLFIESDSSTRLSACILAAIICFISMYFSNKKKLDRFYGGAYHLKSGNAKISYEYGEFCGITFPIFAPGNYLNFMRIESIKGDYILSISVKKTGIFKRGYNYYEISIPNEKEQELREILKKHFGDLFKENSKIKH